MAVRAADYLRARVDAWRTGSRESQVYVALVLLVLIGLSFVVSVLAPAWMPLSAYFVWLLVAMLVLRFEWLLVVAAVNALAGVAAMALNGPLTGARLVAMVEFVLAVLLVVAVASRQRSGLPSTLSDALLPTSRRGSRRRARSRHCRRAGSRRAP